MELNTQLVHIRILLQRQVLEILGKIILQAQLPSAGNFTPAKGYQMAAKGTNSGSGVGAEMTFSGKPNTGTKSISIINSETGNGSDND